MRSEKEVQQMIDAIRNLTNMDHATKWAMVALLENVLHGPKNIGACACLGPPGLCVCDAYALGIEWTQKSPARSL